MFNSQRKEENEATDVLFVISCLAKEYSDRYIDKRAFRGSIRSSILSSIMKVPSIVPIEHRIDRLESLLCTTVLRILNIDDNINGNSDRLNAPLMLLP